MADSTAAPRATDLLAVRSRVSWGAIAAGAMVALAIYFVFTLLGMALGMELVFRRNVDIGPGAAIYSIFTLLLSMFFGGWATSRLAVGETKLEAVLYAIILWGILFVGLFWLIGVGVSAGFGALMSGAVVVVDERADDTRGVASRLAQRYNTELGGETFVADLKKAGVDEAQAQKVEDAIKSRLDRLKNDPTPLSEQARDIASDPDIQKAARSAVEYSRRATWYALIGVVISMAAVIFGSLVGSGDVPVPVPILGVRRPPRDPRM